MTDAEIKTKVQGWVAKASPEQLGRMCVALFERQTNDEKAVNATKHDNNVGFNHADSKGLSIKAKYFLKHHDLLDWQIAKLRKQLPKYWGQLWAIAEAKKAKAA